MNYRFKKCENTVMIKEPVKIALLFAAGGAVYGGIEVATRGFTHVSMFIVGGLCFVLIGGINEYIRFDIPIMFQMFIAAAIVTLFELVSGCIVNLWLGLNVWDYSANRTNFRGQICLDATIIWFFISEAGIILEDFFRWKMFGEKMPRYRML